MLVLGIESTCDETACALVEDGEKIYSNVVASQIELHQEYGGVVPELACRHHIHLMLPVIEQALQEAHVTLDDVDLFAVAQGPGLVGALLIGLNTAKSLALALQKPFVGVNHIEAHLYAATMSQQDPIQFPALGVVLSGGHTNLVFMKEIGSYESIGHTIDDAIGEAFDKVAKLLHLPYPGGPYIEKLAQKGNPQAYSFKAGQMKDKPLDFSFSGLKTAVLYTLQKLKKSSDLNQIDLTDQQTCDIAASFQFAAFDDILKKTLKAAEQFQLKTLIFGGGVTNNMYLKEIFENKCRINGLRAVWPSLGLSLDNAAMIAGLGFHTYKRKGKSDSMDLEPLTRIAF